MTPTFVDIHCHLLPDIDDGPPDWDESLAMARLAIDDGTTTIVATPHQLGNFVGNHGALICARVTELQARLEAADIPLRVLPGGEVRIVPEIIDALACGDVLTLGDHRRHVLLELPHDIFVPLEPLLADLSRRKMICVLAHPERNQGILRRPELVGPLVDAGCLIQITAGSLCGTFGPASQSLAERLLAEGLVHFIASDGHGSRSRRPILRRAYDRVVALADAQTADELCCRNPARAANGQSVRPGRRVVPRKRHTWWARKAVA